MARSILKPDDRRAARDWEAYYDNYVASVTAEMNESEADKRKRISRLEADFEEWKKYYFPKYCYAPAAKFHVRAAKREINNPEWYETRPWARELAKDVVEMMVTLFQVLTKRKKSILLISNSNDKAGDLLEPYRINLASNERIINDYGIQQNPGSWSYGDFTTTQGAAFLAVGAEQSPRGRRTEEVRPDKVIISDIDTDEDVRNPDIIEKRWKWFEKAVYPTRSVSKDFQVIFLGNIIANDSCITRAIEMSDHVDTVNIVDKEGNSSWPEKNTKEHIDRIRGKISTAAFEGEYMNNPVSEGDVFKEMIWGRVPSLKRFRFVIVYGDPSPSNSKNKKNSMKACFAIGFHESKYYVINGFVDHATNPEFVGWHYALNDLLKGKTQPYHYIENNSLQDPFYEQVLIPLFTEAAKKKGFLGVTPDTRDKPEKFSRIEGALEPLNRAGKLILNEKEKENPHMKRLEEQFKLCNAKQRFPMDGPDSIEGGKWIVDLKMSEMTDDSWKTWKKGKNKHRI